MTPPRIPAKGMLDHRLTPRSQIQRLTWEVGGGKGRWRETREEKREEEGERGEQKEKKKGRKGEFLRVIGIKEVKVKGSRAWGAHVR